MLYQRFRNTCFQHIHANRHEARQHMICFLPLDQPLMRKEHPDSISCLLQTLHTAGGGGGGGGKEGGEGILCRGPVGACRIR